MFLTRNVAGLEVAVTNLTDVTDYVINSALQGNTGYVCAANVHMCMEAVDNSSFRADVNGANLVIPDGKPLFWWLRMVGEKAARQVRGPDLFEKLIEKAIKKGIPMAVYGGSQETLSRIRDKLARRYSSTPEILLLSPPYRALNKDEEDSFIKTINDSGARIVFVGLGCPKQERWMARNSSRIEAVMLGVGAALDFYAETKSTAPLWVRAIGLEWLHRLLSEPGRLWKRYLLNNPRFMYLYLKAWISR